MATSLTNTQTGLTEDQRDKFLQAVVESNALYSGRGSSQSINQTLLTRYDRFGSAAIQTNSETVGMTFFTRPKLNLSTTSLRQDRQLVMLDTLDPLSWMFSIRANLDSYFMTKGAGQDAATSSPWVSHDLPFIPILTNNLISMSGWPDFTIESKTSEAGYFEEDMTLARGSDRGRRTYDLSCTFRDIEGGYLMAFFYYWLHSMALQMEGSIVAYPEDRDQNRLNYTCSIYRLVLDSSFKTVRKWAKATGCFPYSLPIGDIFNFGAGDHFIHTSREFTVPFKVNNVTYMDPIHLQAFNTLIERYNDPNILKSNDYVKVPINAQNNFVGVPYIDIYNGTNELIFKAKKQDLIDPSATIIQQLSNISSSQTKSPYIDKYTTKITET